MTDDAARHISREGVTPAVRGSAQPGELACVRLAALLTEDGGDRVDAALVA
jgi:hypothetical protein